MTKPKLKEEIKMVGLFHGRFQPLTVGHARLIDFLFNRCNEVYILVGSSQKSRTKINPFTYEERKMQIQKTYPKAIILPAPDLGLGDNRKWGQHLINIITQNNLPMPNITISSEDTQLKEIFQDWPQIETVVFPRSIESSTALREILSQSDQQNIEKILPSALWTQIPKLIEIIKQSTSQDEKIEINK